MNEQVVIVGAGPVGMLLACELLQQHIPVRLVDAAREHSAHSRATIVWPRLLELMRRTDMTERLAANGHRIDGVAYFSSGRRLGTAWMNRLTDTPYPFAVAIAQSETERLLEDRLTELGGKIERGVRLTGVRNPRGPRPTAVLTTADGGTEEVDTDWLIGADGAHSVVRGLLDAGFEGEQFDVSFAITDAEVHGDAPMNVVSYCYTPDGSLALGPLGSDVTRVAVSVPHPEDDTPPSREFFQRILDERGPGRNAIGELRFSTTFRIHARTAGRFRSGHCLLAGDAAHIMSPAGAQGMNTGLQDAVNLGWRLGGIINGLLPESAITGYDRERRSAAHAVARNTSRQTRWGLLRKGSQIAVRDAALRTAAATGLLQRSIAPLVAQTAVRYPAADGRPAGHRLPGARTRTGDRLPVLPTGPIGASGAAKTTGAAGITDTADNSLRIGGRLWARTADDTLTVLLWPGRRPGARWAETVRRVTAAAAPHAAVVTPAAAPGPLADALGHRATIAVVRPDGHLLTALAPDRVAELPAVLAAAHAHPDPAPYPS
ncbi:FAD-dependent monooxygenase [Streptomyces sp. NPDC050617]|uniref:FAD-dependent monooxygenase n=1 Tax=Streptomyces sp. NPDC050617 TaxID=3154628 RepID=UPI00344AA934